MGNSESTSNEREKDARFRPDAPGKKHVGVLGAGSSGLIVMKELTSLGHTVECFDLLPCLGGVYVKSYESTILTTSSLLTAWSDYSDGKEADPKFWTAEEYLNYLTCFAKKHDLLKYINFSHRVECIRKDPATGKWNVTVRGGQGCQNIERCEAVPEDPKVVNWSFFFCCACVILKRKQTILILTFLYSHTCYSSLLFLVLV